VSRGLKGWWGVGPVVAAVMLAGCAAQTAFREGQGLVAQGRLADGLVKLEEASHLEPGSAQYRIAYLQTRDRLALGLIEQADQARQQNRYDEAERLFRQVLAAQAQQDRALSGLRLLDQQRRWDKAVKEAEAAMARKDWDTARQKLRATLLEQPQHAQAGKLLQQIEERTAAVSTEPALAQAYKNPITIEFKDAPLRTVFEVISRTSRLNFLFDKDVRTDQRTSIYLRNSTVEAAVSWLLLVNQLEQRVLDGNSILIYPATQAKQRDYQPLTVKSFYLANADAKTIAATLKAIIKARDVVVDEKLNLVIVRDSPEAIRLAEKLIRLHDVPEPEVMLEVEILEVKRSKLLDLGVRWPDQATLSLLPSIGTSLTLEDLRNPTRSAVGVSMGPTVITAKKTDSDTNLLANPRIRARNREKAKIMIGERVPNITTTSTSTGFVAESINYVDVGLKLEVEPTIYLDNEVAIKIALEVSSIISQQQTKLGSVAYQLGNRTAQTVLRLKDGETQVLAGLINDEDRRSASKVPGLGELPVLGRLFGGQADDASKTEIVLSITPRVLRNVQRPDAATLEFGSGTEGSLRGWPSDAGAAPAAPAAGPGPAPTSAPPAMEPARVSPPPAVSDATPAPAPISIAETTDTGAVAGATQLRWEGPTQVKAGDSFALQLSMQSEQPVTAMPMSVGFDPRALQVLNVMEGGLLKQGGAQTTFSHRTEGSGRVVLSVSRSGGSGATGPGVLATFAMKALASAAVGETRVQIVAAAPQGTDGRGLVMPLPGPHVVTVSR